MTPICKTFTEHQVKELGFTKTKMYDHDHFVTHKYLKGVIEIEFTYNYKNSSVGILETVDVTLLEVIGKEMDFGCVRLLDTILNNNLIREPSEGKALF